MSVKGGAIPEEDRKILWTLSQYLLTALTIGDWSIVEIVSHHLALYAEGEEAQLIEVPQAKKEEVTEVLRGWD